MNNIAQYAELTCRGRCPGDRTHACRGWTDGGDGRWQCRECGARRRGPSPQAVIDDRRTA